MAKPISGLQSVVSQLRKERTNLVNQLRHVDAALAVLGKLNGGSSWFCCDALRGDGLADEIINTRQGALWDLAAFACVSLAPALGLPPQPPGVVVADLHQRQL